MFKYCRYCDQSLPLDAFARSKAGKYGRTAKCKACQSAYAKQHRANNKERLRERQKESKRRSNIKNREKIREYNLRYRAENRERVIALCKRWRTENADQVREYRKRYYAQNRERVLAAFKRWSSENRERRCEYSRQYRIANLEAVKERARRWCKAHPDLVVQYATRRRIRLANAEGSHTHQEWLAVVWAQQFCCAHCGSYELLTRDHIVPITKGGSDYISNIQGLCRSCNSRKKDKMPDDLVF